MSLDGADLERQSQAPLWGTVALSPAQPRHEGALAKFNVPSILVGVCLQTWRSPRWTVKSTGRRCRSRRASQAQIARGGAREPRLLRPHLAAGLWSALVSTTHLLGKLQIKNRNCPALGGGESVDGTGESTIFGTTQLWSPVSPSRLSSRVPCRAICAS